MGWEWRVFYPADASDGRGAGAATGGGSSGGGGGGSGGGGGCATVTTAVGVWESTSEVRRRCAQVRRAGARRVTRGRCAAQVRTDLYYVCSEAVGMKVCVMRTLSAPMECHMFYAGALSLTVCLRLSGAELQWWRAPARQVGGGGEDTDGVRTCACA